MTDQLVVEVFHRGLQGLEGSNLNRRGTYSAVKGYVAKDSVIFGSDSYYLPADYVGTLTAVSPPTSPWLVDLIARTVSNSALAAAESADASEASAVESAASAAASQNSADDSADSAAQALASLSAAASVALGPNPKVAVLCATTANITLSGEQTLDGVLTSASPALVKDQTTSSQNGLYTTGAGAWTRRADMDAWAEVVGATVMVLAGTANGASAWLSTSASSGTIGTTAITWTLFDGKTAILTAFPDEAFPIGPSSLARSMKDRIKDYTTASEEHATGVWGVSKAVDLAAMVRIRGLLIAGSRPKHIIMPNQTAIFDPNDTGTYAGFNFDGMNDLRITGAGNDSVIKVPLTTLASAEMIAIRNSYNVCLENINFDYDAAMQRYGATGDFTNGSGAITNVSNTTGMAVGRHVQAYYGYTGVIQSIVGSTVNVLPVYTQTGDVTGKPLTVCPDGSVTMFAALNCVGVRLNHIRLASYGRFGFALNSCIDMVIEDIQGTKGIERTTNSLIVIASSITPSKNATIRNVRAAGTGLQVDVDTCDIDDVIVDGFGVGAAFACAQASGDNCKNIKITKCEAKNAASLLDDFDVYPTGAEIWSVDTTIDTFKTSDIGGNAVAAFGKRGKIRNVTALNCGNGTVPLQGIAVSYIDTSFTGENMEVEGCHIQGAGSHGIEILTNNALIRGNRCVNNGQVTGASGIKLSWAATNKAADGSVLVGNICTDTQGTKTQLFGADFDGNVSGVYLDESNKFSGNKNYNPGSGIWDVRFADTNNAFGTLNKYSITAISGVTIGAGVSSVVASVSVPGIRPGDLVDVGTSLPGASWFSFGQAANSNGYDIYFRNTTAGSLTSPTTPAYIRVTRPSL